MFVAYNTTLLTTSHTKERQCKHAVCVAQQKQKFEAYYFLQLWDLQVLLMNLLILHLQNFFQALQVLLNVFVWGQSLLETADNCSENQLFWAADEAHIMSRAVTTICSSVLLRRASSKRLARSLRLRFWNVSVSTWSWWSEKTSTRSLPTTTCTMLL